MSNINNILQELPDGRDITINYYENPTINHYVLENTSRLPGYNNYGDQLYQTVKNLGSDTVATVNNKCSPSYHGLPNSKDYKLFKKNKGRIINISDFLIVFKL